MLKVMREMGERVIPGWRHPLGCWVIGAVNQWKNICEAYRQGRKLYGLFNDGKWRPLKTLDHLSDEHLLHFLGCDDVGDWKAVLRRYGLLGKLKFYVTAPVNVGKRSSVAFKIGRSLFDAGGKEEEIIVVLLATKCFVSKRGNNPKAARQRSAANYEMEAMMITPKHIATDSDVDARAVRILIRARYGNRQPIGGGERQGSGQNNKMDS